MTAGLLLLTVAAVRAQAAYMRRFDGVDVSRPLARKAIMYALAGSACFMAAKVMR
jgi:hypothetical protein